jgi:putative membrane-bound dehydrogenase-like protein
VTGPQGTLCRMKQVVGGLSSFLFGHVFGRLGVICASLILPIMNAQEDPPAPVPVNEAAQKMTVPDGFKVTLFAGEPDLVQPIAMTTDERGRLWVIECLSYPSWTNKVSEDRVVIFEDTNGDGKFDTKKVFLNNGRNLTGLALGFGGVYLCSLPNFIFVPDRDHDDKPDGPPEVLLDGWDIESKHNAFNGLTWGPDGWLYGCNGILGSSKIGKPGTPEDKRIAMNCGVWRWHPTRQIFEVVAHGTTNPWGIGFNDYGQMFIANCVIKHLFHIIPGARYERMYGQDMNPYAFELLPSCADHIHWAGGFWKTEGAASARNDTAGGGHAHCGAMVYLGDNWPDQYRNTFFTLNVHGHRINNDTLERRGSGYVARHAPDVLKANDPWFRGVSLIYGPDGAVYMSDWSDAGECHDYIDIHRENGRIYKITYGAPKPVHVNLRALPDSELVNLQNQKNAWFADNARHELQQRAAQRKNNPQTRSTVLRLLRTAKDPVVRLRALWCLNALRELDEKSAALLLADKDEYIRAWTVQLALDTREAPPSALLDRLSTMSCDDKSPVVHLYLASAMQRLSLKERLPLGEGLASHNEDVADPNLPLMIWYGIEPIASADEKAAIAVLAKARIPLVRQYIAQRLSLRMILDPLSTMLSQTKDGGLAADVVRGIFNALNGRRQLAMPRNWNVAFGKLMAHENSEVREQALQLSLIFGNPDAAGQLRKRATDLSLSPEARRTALQALIQARVPDLSQFLQSRIGDEALRLTAIRGLAAFDDPATPRVLLDNYGNFKTEEKTETISTLSARDNYAIALLEAVKAGKVPRRDISPFAARQIQAHANPRIAELLTQTLGNINAISRQKAEQIAQYKKILTPDVLKGANRSHGHAVFNRTCSGCHTLFGEGGKLAPELTGSQRTSLDYLLENIVDPNAVVWNQYKATYFETSDDRLITGVILRENESTVTIQTATGTITLPRNEITSRRQSELSLMPEGLLDTLEKQDLFDLFAYLQSPTQVPLQEAK